MPHGSDTGTAPTSTVRGQQRKDRPVAMSALVVQQTAMAAVLSATSNVLAQLITAQKTGQAFTIDPAPVFKFVLFTVLNTPPNILWQAFLEDEFPGEKKLPPAASKTPTEEKSAMDVVKDNARQMSAGTDWKNVFSKFLLDQTLGGVVNTALFIAGMKAMNGGSSQEIKLTVKEDLWPIFFAGTKVWPLVSIISFTVISVNNRVLFGSIVGVAWGVYLSLMAAQ